MELAGHVSGAGREMWVGDCCGRAAGPAAHCLVVTRRKRRGTGQGPLGPRCPAGFRQPRSLLSRACCLRPEKPCEAETSLHIRPASHPSEVKTWYARTRCSRSGHGTMACCLARLPNGGILNGAAIRSSRSATSEAAPRPGGSADDLRQCRSVRPAAWVRSHGSSSGSPAPTRWRRATA